METKVIHQSMKRRRKSSRALPKQQQMQFRPPSKRQMLLRTNRGYLASHAVD